VASESQVTDAEVEAIVAMVRPAVEEVAQILPRDFKAPRRLSRAQLDVLARRVERTLPELSAHLSALLRGPHRARVADVVEANVGTLIDGFVEPLRTLAFDVGPQLGFVAWDLGAMTAAIETALGSPDPKMAHARPLSIVEERVLEKLLVRVAMLTLSALGVEGTNYRILREKKELSLAEDATTSDHQRIGVHLALEGAAGESVLRVYVPAVKAPELPNAGGTPKNASKTGVTSQLADVRVDLCAELGTIAVPLHDLMSLEVGDVVLLDTKVGDMVALIADGEVRARGELGRHDGKLAVRMRSVDRERAKATDGK
jgi:flagellar motor switch protein FliM